MTIILKNKANNIVAQFPKESFERFYIGLESLGAATLTIVHVDGTVTILDERLVGIDVHTIAASLSEQLEEKNVVDEFARLKDKVSSKLQEVKSNTQIAVAVASIYKDVLVSKLFSSKPKTDHTEKETVQEVKTETKSDKNSVLDVGLDELFNKLEQTINSMADKKSKTTPSDDDIVSEIHELYLRDELTYTRLYNLIGLVRQNVKRKTSTSPELDRVEIVSILRMNDLI